MIEEHLDEGTPLRAFRTAGDLRWETAYRHLSHSPFKGQRKCRDDVLVTELIRAAACLAFELLRQSGTYVVQREEVIKSVKLAAKHRFGGDQWERYDKLLRESLTSGSAVFRRYSVKELSFPSQKSMEFFAGLYLARYADDSAIQQLLPLIGHHQWNEVWTFTIEMPLTTNAEGEALHNVDSLQRSMSALFVAPVDAPRPTEHMFHAWQIMKRNPELYPGLEPTLAFYRQQFRDILSGQAPVPTLKLSEGAETPTRLNRAQRAAELITEADLDRLAKEITAQGIKPPEAGWWRKIKPRHAAYALCSNGTSSSPLAKASTDKAKLTFLMGASPVDTSAQDREKYDARDPELWWVEREIEAFHMAACCVTRAQYWLFDEHREQENQTGNYGKSQRAPDDDCPITYVDWFDSSCLALWLGAEYELPTEEQWEGAAWGGIDRAAHREAVISVPPYHAGYTSNAVNHDGNKPLWQKGPDYLLRTLPVRWDAERRARSGIATKPDAYEANGFGLWQVNGNVFERSRSGCADGELKLALERMVKEINDNGVDRRAFLVIRGRSYGDPAWLTRTSERSCIYADNRNSHLGFRLSRTVNSDQPQPDAE